MSPDILQTLAALRARTARWRQAGESVAVVPTMGALHDGHLSLVAAAKADADRVIVTIFVNPKQFNNPADLAKYPRTEEDDAAKLAPLGVDVVYAPAPDQIYPPGFATAISVSGLADPLEGEFRPGHFEGVATVVAKLFTQTGADRAYFGEKDFQQLLVVRRMARDLDIPISVVACPTVRESDGLAMSSRNLRITPENRKAAARLHAEMQKAATAILDGAAAEAALARARAALEAAGFGPVEYLALHDAEDLSAVADAQRPARLLAAAWLGEVRLIDNIAVR